VNRFKQYLDPENNASDFNLKKVINSHMNTQNFIQLRQISNSNSYFRSFSRKLSPKPMPAVRGEEAPQQSRNISISTIKRARHYRPEFNEERVNKPIPDYILEKVKNEGSIIQPERSELKQYISKVCQLNLESQPKAANPFDFSSSLTRLKQTQSLLNLKFKNVQLRQDVDFFDKISKKNY